MASTIPTIDRQLVGANPQEICNKLADVAAAAIVDIEALQSSSGALDWKDSVLVATTANITLSGAQTIDGVSVTAGKRVLVKDQSTGSQNGIYVCAAGAWSRSSDADASAKVTPNLAVAVERGTVNADKIFYLDVDGDIVLGTTALTFVDFRGIAITAPADVTKAAAAVGTSATVARSDHKHDVSTAAAGTAAIGDSAAEGSATSLARSDHTHAFPAPAAPADVTKAAASAGAATTFARADHKHDVSTATAVGLTSASTTGEGASTSLARADHVHGITALNGASAGTGATKSAGAFANADFTIPQLLILDVPAGASGNVDFTNAPWAFRVIDVFAQKVTTSADAGDQGQLQDGTGAAISSSFALNVAADAIVRTTSIVAATATIAAFGTLRWGRTQSTNAACHVYVWIVRA